MKRRTFVQAGASAMLLAGLPRLTIAQHKPFDPRPGEWRTFEMTTRVVIEIPQGATRAWVPVPSVESDYQTVIGHQWSGNGKMRLAHDPAHGAAMVMAEWEPSVKEPTLEVVSRFATRNRATRFGRRDPAMQLDAGARRLYTAPTELIQTDGIVRATAQEIVKGKRTEIEKARAIYEWIVENTERDPKTRGCGIGDVRGMLETRNLKGKCADLNALYVGLARAAGLPARDVYGIRVARSEFGYRSLGVGSPAITRAQHCRAEVFLTGYGWVPVDPADVRKVVLEERPKPTTLADPVVPPVRQKLFGAWEGNWVAYNDAHDVKLPSSKGPAVGFLMYPQAETGNERLDSLDPDRFRYTISVREVKA